MKNCIKEYLNELNYYSGVVIHPEPDILECKVKWALGSTAVNKASGCSEIAKELNYSNHQRRMPSRSCIHYVSKSGRSSRSHKTGKGSILIPILKNVLTIRQLHSSPILVRLCLKSCMLGFSIIQNKNFQMSNLGLEKEEELEIKLPTFS